MTASRLNLAGMGVGYAPACPFQEADLQFASDAWGCNCGPGALAMMLNLPLESVRGRIPEFDVKQYTNPTMMKAALAAFGVAWQLASDRFPRYGLCRIQWEGPWTKPGVPPRVAYRKTHWIGTMEVVQAKGNQARFPSERFVYDVNAGWFPFEHWELHTVPWLLKMYPGATGWSVAQKWELIMAEVKA
jgi:hypothetical protein